MVCVSLDVSIDVNHRVHHLGPLHSCDMMIQWPLPVCFMGYSFFLQSIAHVLYP